MRRAADGQRDPIVQIVCAIQGVLSTIIAIDDLDISMVGDQEINIMATNYETGLGALTLDLLSVLDTDPFTPHSLIQGSSSVPVMTALAVLGKERSTVLGLRSVDGTIYRPPPVEGFIYPKSTFPRGRPDKINIRVNPITGGKVCLVVWAFG